MKNVVLFLALIPLFLLTGCEKDDGDGNLRTIDLSGIWSWPNTIINNSSCNIGGYVIAPESFRFSQDDNSVTLVDGSSSRISGTDSNFLLEEGKLSFEFHGELTMDCSGNVFIAPISYSFEGIYNGTSFDGTAFIERIDDPSMTQCAPHHLKCEAPTTLARDDTNN